MQQKEFDELYEQHLYWLNEEKEGKVLHLRYKNLSGLDLSNKDLRYIDFFRADLSNTNFTNSNLKFTSLDHVNLQNSNLQGTNLSHATFRNSKLSNASLKRAIVEGADFERVNFNSVKLTDIDFSLVSSLYRVKGNGKEIKEIKADRYHICYTRILLQIGCILSPIEDWRGSFQREIFELDQQDHLGGLEWWMENYKDIFKRIESDPAE